MSVQNQKGFSLIELLIVVLVIGIIAAIAVPNILSARRSANEGSAISSLRVMHSAQMIYKTTAGGGNFAGTSSNTGDQIGLNLLRDANLVDSTVGNGSKSGYNFVGAISNPGTYSTGFFFAANPVSASGVTKTGNRRFGITHDGLLRADINSIEIPFDGVSVESAPQFVN